MQEKTFKHATHFMGMNKKVKRAVLIFLIIVVIFTLIYTYRKLNLMIREDIILELDNTYASTWLDYGEEYSFNADAEINNYWLCKASCEQHIIDLHSGEYLFNETFNVTNNKKKSASIKITPHKGYGQSIYQYEIKCQNILSNRCPAANDSYIRKSTLIVNHEPNDMQKEIIEQAIFLSNNMSYNVAYSELNIDNVTNIMYNIDVNFPEVMKNEASKYSKVLSDLKNSEKQITTEWNDDEYEKAHTIIFSKHDLSNELFTNTSKLLRDVRETVDKHNTIVITHKRSLVDAIIIKNMLKYYPGNINEFNNDAITSLSLVNINTIKMNKLEDYNSLLREAQLEKSTIDYTINLFNSKISSTKSDYVDLYLADALACTVLGCNRTNINYSLTSIDDAEYRCMLYNEIYPKFVYAHNINSENREEYNGSLEYFDNVEKTIMAAILSRLQVNDSAINTKIIAYLSQLDTSNSSLIIDSIPQNFLSLEFQPMINSLKNIDSYCNRESQNFSFDTYSIYEQRIPELSQQITIEKISQPIQKCCVLGKCDPCGIDKKNPLILLHGHSFNQKNSAYQSTDVFNQLENTLSPVEYVSLGIWLPYANPKNTIQTNALFKPTYYITIYDDILGTNTNLLGTNAMQSKDESIEEYSKRLKNTIDNIKLITGSNKVDIAAHSMGGLVTRRYIQKYGPDDIDNLILIGTPNNGITDRVYGACKFFGNEKECNEMHQESEFIKLLNQNYPMPKTTLIIGKGCDMQGKDGDGVVTVDSAKLNNYKIYYIQGDCEETFLHNKMLNTPEVSERILDIVD